ncbi:MAG: NADH-quinone oxidoreductase subunit I [Ignavibacteria bacterium]|nr:NADH-quinone oxidoreductase subunit I [Bacteroidota bacterium]MSQ46488.1 NADH-quinone oxidoreductase subunit I [Ignavibacteria bacterium]
MNAITEYFGNITQSLKTISIGMGVTFKHLFTPAVTIQYPTVKMKLPERSRNRLYVNMDDCIGCDQCSKACPVNCIEIEIIKSTPEDDLGITSSGQKKKLHVPVFNIDIAKCCYCGLCVYPCPTECIYMTNVYEFSEFDRNNLIYNFAKMTPAEIETAQIKVKKMDEETAAKKVAAALVAAQAKAALDATTQTSTPQQPTQPQ